MVRVSNKHFKFFFDQGLKRRIAKIINICTPTFSNELYSNQRKYYGAKILCTENNFVKETMEKHGSGLWQILEENENNGKKLRWKKDLNEDVVNKWFSKYRHRHSSKSIKLYVLIVHVAKFRGQSPIYYIYP